MISAITFNDFLLYHPPIENIVVIADTPKPPKLQEFVIFEKLANCISEISRCAEEIENITLTEVWHGEPNKNQIPSVILPESDKLLIDYGY